MLPVVASLIEHRILLAAHSIEISDADAGSIADAVKQPRRALLSNGMWLAYDDNAAFAQGIPISQQPQIPSDAPCVFYFHGLMSSRLERHPAVGPFGVRIITVDRPGQGMSDYRQYTYEDFCGFVCELADIMGIKKFGVVGFSSGGPYALAMA
jgi:pimeloyl-ACP methyl ester carboxylesterase